MTLFCIYDTMFESLFRGLLRTHLAFDDVNALIYCYLNNNDRYITGDRYIDDDLNIMYSCLYDMFNSEVAHFIKLTDCGDKVYLLVTDEFIAC